MPDIEQKHLGFLKEFGGVDYLYVTHVDLVPFAQHQHGVALARVKATTEYSGPVGGLMPELAKDGYATIHLTIEADRAPKVGSLIRTRLDFEQNDYEPGVDGNPTQRISFWGDKKDKILNTH